MLVGLGRTTAIAANFLALFVTVPLVGMLGDRIGRKPLLWIGVHGFVILSLPGYMLASTGNFFPAIVGQLLVALPWSFVVSAVVVEIVEILPTRVRYSGASIGYNLGYMIFGGTAPIVATFLVSATGSDAAPAVYLIVGPCSCSPPSSCCRRPAASPRTGRTREDTRLALTSPARSPPRDREPIYKG